MKPYGTSKVILYKTFVTFVVLRAVTIKLPFSGMKDSVIWYRGYQPIKESNCLHLHEKGGGR
jgi:hypothetical protein